MAGVDGQEHGALGFPLAPNTHDPGTAGRTQQCWLSGLDLVEVNQHKFLASESCGQQQEHDGTISDRSAVAMQPRRVPFSPAAGLCVGCIVRAGRIGF